MFVVRSLVLVCALAVLALAQSGLRPKQTGSQLSYAQVEAATLVNRPADFLGRRVTLTAEIISINVQKRALDLFDAQSRATIGVSLAELPKSQRRQLVAEPVHHVAV